MRSAPPAVSAIAVPPAFTYQPDPAARLVAPAAYAEAALARAEYRASLLADRPILDRRASPRPRFEAPAAERTPSVLLAVAERLDYQARLVNLERFSTWLAGLVDIQAHALWTANARPSALEPESRPPTLRPLQAPPRPGPAIASVSRPASAWALVPRRLLCPEAPRPATLYNPLSSWPRLVAPVGGQTGHKRQ